MSTLPPRGAALSASPSARLLAHRVNESPFHPTDNPSGWVNLGTAENHCSLPDIADHLSTQPISLSTFDYSYGEGTWGTSRLRRALARHLNLRLKTYVDVQERDVIVANGVSSVLNMLAFCLAEPGDGVLMSRPIYQSFEGDVGFEAGAKPVWVAFEGQDQFAPEAVACYERALVQAEAKGTKVRALLLCHPHNPLGKCYPRETIVELMRLCRRYGVHLLSDEIYAVSVFEVENEERAAPFESVLAFDSREYIDERYLHVIYGMSKDFGTSGLRIGCVHTKNEELWHALNRVSEFHWIGIADQRVAIQLLEDETWLSSFFDRSRSRLAERSALARTLLEERGIGHYRGANAGFFILVDLRPFLRDTGKEGWEAEQILAERMNEAKVFVTPGKILSAEEPGWFRIIFSQDESVLREGMRRFLDVVVGDSRQVDPKKS